MITQVTTESITAYLRVQPGENLHHALTALLVAENLRGGSVVSAAGSARSVKYGVVDLDAEGVPFYKNQKEIRAGIEIIGISGSLGIDIEGEPAAHLHGSFALPDGRVFAGHIYDLTTLVTVEVAVIASEASVWLRDFERFPGGHKMPIFVPTGKASSSQQERRTPFRSTLNKVGSSY